MNKVQEYFHGAFAEMKKVVWPTKKQATTYTLIVLGLCLGIAIFFGILDNLFNLGLGFIIK
ncbi:MAG TPA: preprotein translocase subunit SecE [Patescibacteria group bacterium]|nr:preprotein translocase subunit SecE [Patescibacteria group bacterium]